MGKVISVASFEDMDKASKRLQSLSEIYTDIYSQLLQEANTMGSAWEGADNLAFVEQINGFTEEHDILKFCKRRQIRYICVCEVDNTYIFESFNA